MRIKRTMPRSRRTRRAGAPAVAAGLLAAMAWTAPAAHADAAGTFSASRLRAAGDAVLSADVAGTAWYVDQETNGLVLTVDSTVSEAEIAKIRRTAGPDAGALRIERTGGKLARFMTGGNAIYSTAGRCSVGFNVRSGGTYYFLTAGHCTESAPTWYTGAARVTAIGPTAGSSFPGNDFGIVRYASSSVARPGKVGSVDITGTADATIGMSVTRRGSTSGVHSGRVLGLGATVNYGGGDVVTGLIRTNVCAEPGDSGGPLYSGSRAIGLTSGGSGNCTFGGTTYFQPVAEALNTYGVSVY